jgi:hypothetical protein
MSLSYAEAKQDIISGLLQAVSGHEAARLSGIETAYDTLDAKLSRDAGPEFDKRFIALNFCDGWIDARKSQLAI